MCSRPFDLSVLPMDVARILGSHFSLVTQHLTFIFRAGFLMFPLSMIAAPTAEKKERDGEDTIASTRAACAPRNSRRFLSDGNDGSRFDGTRLRLVCDQLAQERNQHDERNTDREAAGAKLREEFRVPGVGGDRSGAGRLGNHSRKVARKQ